MARHFTVKPGDKLQPGEIAIWEVHKDHPDGEILIAAPHPGEDAQSFKVARTPAINERLADGRLMQPGRSQSDDDEEPEDAPATGTRGRRPAAPPEA